MAGVELPENRNHRENKQAATQHRDLSNRLDIILADMLRSALVWEQNHGQPENLNSNQLTYIKKKNIFSSSTNKTLKEDNDDNHNEQQPTNNI